MRNRFLLLVCGAGLCTSALTPFAQAPRASPDAGWPALVPSETREIDAVARAELTAWRAPGMVLAVVRDDSLAYLTAYGIANVETREPMATDMLVSVASVTKMVTATTLLTLAAEEKLNLDAQIRTYLPWLSPRLGALTSAQLLSHTSGLGELTPPVLPEPSGALVPICRAIADRAFVADPGEAWGYSNTGYTLAGCVIEAVAGTPYPQAVTQTVFRPLGMTHSTFNPTVAMTYRHAQGHDTRGDIPTVVRPFNSAPWVGPAGELITTVGDLSRLARALLADGVLDGKQVLPPGLVSRFATVRGRGGPFLAGERDYGLGLFVRSHRGLRILEHEGVYAGFGASFALAPDRGIAAIAVTNGRFGSPVRTTQAAVEITAGLSPSAAEPTRGAIPSDQAARAVGRYAGAAGTVEIVMADGTLSLKQGDQVFPLRAHPAGHWQVPGYPPYLPWTATLEVVGAGERPSFLRLGWRLYRRLE